MTRQQGYIEQEEKISLLFENAQIELSKIEEQAKKEKERIVNNLTKDLEGKILIDTIRIEIVNQLPGRVSERFIRDKQYRRSNSDEFKNDI